MEINNAMKIIVEALELANKAGVYNLQDSATIVTAINVVNNHIEQTQLASSTEAEVKEVLPTIKPKK